IARVLTCATTTLAGLLGLTAIFGSLPPKRPAFGLPASRVGIDWSTTKEGVVRSSSESSESRCVRFGGRFALREAGAGVSSPGVGGGRSGMRQVLSKVHHHLQAARTRRGREGGGVRGPAAGE